MSLIGNIIWLIFGGFLAGLGYIVGGLVLCLTIIGIPIAAQHMKLVKVALLPFGHEMREIRGLLERLVEQRGFSEADARARMANQASREERLRIADFVIDNGGDLAQLDSEVERCWDWLSSLS